MGDVGLDFETLSDAHRWIDEGSLLSQQLFHFSNAKDTTMFSGVGSGKTAALIVRAIFLAALNPNNMGLIGRDTETNLLETTQKDFFELCPSEILLPGTRKGRNGKAVIKTTGKPSTIVFRYFKQSSAGVKHLSGINLGFAAADQAEDITKDEWGYVQTRLRRANIRFHPMFRILNPKGHDWNWQQCIQPAQKAFENGNLEAKRITTVPGYKGKPVDVAEYWADEDTYSIVTWTHENRYLPDGFIESIEKNETREYIQRYLYSSFDEWGGKVYKAFYSGSAHVIQPFRIPDDWPCIVSIDVGGDSPWAILTLRFDPIYGDCFVTNEFYKPSVLTDEIMDYLTDRVKSGIPNVFDHNTRIIGDPENKPALLELFNRGLIIESARKQNKAGSIMRAAAYMQPKRGRRYELPGQYSPDKGFHTKTIEEAPHLWVFDRCEHFREEHESWLWRRDAQTGLATNEPEDKNDHTCDALLYGLRVRPEVKRLPATDPAIDKLRRAHHGSYVIAQKEREELNPTKKPWGANIFSDGSRSDIIQSPGGPTEWRKYL